MDRCQRVARLWNWLPSFRAIAETENLSAASAHLHVTPPALSRTLRLLEEDLEIQLFDRVGRNLVLNDAGRALLVQVRESMRRIHTCIEQIGADGPSEIRISAPGTYLRLFVQPALNAFDTPVIPQLFRLPDSATATALRKGIVDFVLTHESVEAKDLSATPLPNLRFSVYRTKGAAPVRTEPRFAILVDPVSRRPIDGWPEDEPRQIAVKTEHVEDLVDALHNDDLWAFLPDVVAEHHGLERVEGMLSQEMPFYLLRRPPLPNAGLIDRVTEHVIGMVHHRLAQMRDRARPEGPRLVAIGS